MFTHKKIFITLIPLLIFITLFSLTIQESFAETRQECRSTVAKDQSLTPVERILALRTCSSENSVSTFQETYTEERHNECERRAPHDTWFNHLLRMRDLEQCNRLEIPDTTQAKEKITKFSKVLIDFCGEKYEIYQYIGAKKLRNHAGIQTPLCLDLYSTSIWNSTDKDRQAQLHNFLIEKTQQRLDASKEIREKIVEESRLERPIITTLKDLFDEQKQKIEDLENKLRQENIEPIYFQQDFFDEKIEGCSRIYYDDTVLLKEKIDALNRCFGLEANEPIAINRTAISEYSKNAVQYCEERFPFFSQLSKQEYYDSFTKDPLVQKCSILYSNPLWDYNQNDRTQVLETLLNIEIQKNIYKNSQNENNSYMAILDSRWEPVLIDIYEYQKQKIEFLVSRVNLI